MAKAKKENENAIQTVHSSMAEVPDYLVNFDGPSGVEELAEFITPSRLKVVQSQSTALLEEFDVGDVVLMPQKILVMKKGAETPLIFTPLLFFPEWAKWNDYKANKAGEPVILERTFDRNSGIAQRAKDANLRYEVHPTNGEWKLNYAEHLCFIGIIQNVEGLEFMPVVLSFTRGEHKFGSSFSTLISMRRLPGGKPAPIYSGVYTLELGHRKNGEGNWYGLTPGSGAANYGFDSFVTREQFDIYRELHVQLKAEFDANKIRVDYEDERPETVSTEAPEGSPNF